MIPANQALPARPSFRLRDHAEGTLGVAQANPIDHLVRHKCALSRSERN